jgi:hypothetical protein
LRSIDTKVNSRKTLGEMMVHGEWNPNQGCQIFLGTVNQNGKNTQKYRMAIK